MDMQLKVKLASFEGPLDLLLYLIRQNEINIHEIQIAEITETYLKTLDKMREFNLDITGDFILMASTLILIKSRKLLPQEKVEELEEAGEISSEEELRRRLLEHQRFQEVAQKFKDLPRLNYDTFRRPLPEEKQKKDLVLKEMSLSDLSVAFEKVLLRNRRPVRQVQRESLSVAEAASSVFKKLYTGEAIEFESLFDELEERNEVVACFLAILELGRLKIIRVLQHINYGTIYIVLREALAQEEVEKLFATGDAYAYNPPEVSN